MPLISLGLLSLLSGLGCAPDPGVEPETDADADGVSPAEGDCDDADPTRYPGAPEVSYDGVDQDCSGDADADYDGDGVAGGPEGADCADDDPEAFPGAGERCNGADDDCDGEVDEAVVDPVPLYTDRDGDGFGAGDVVASGCSVPRGLSRTADDCDDLDAGVFPGASESCNDADDDCDGEVDESPADGVAMYADADTDGFGDDAAAATVCPSTPGYTLAGGDCAPDDPLRYPGAPEWCDGLDGDCNGAVDDGSSLPERSWYRDADSDGFGWDADELAGCSPPAGYTALGGDCDDGSAARSPGASELCNGVDDDCDAGVDEEATDAADAYPDLDADGFGDAEAGVPSCTLPVGWTWDGSDCDDAQSAVAPGQSELCDGSDNDCDGATDEGTALDAETAWLDADGDGVGTEAASVLACLPLGGWSERSDDCDDGEARAWPGAVERCDGVDNDCDGEADVGAVDAHPFYADGDGDSFGDAGSVAEPACAAGAGWVANARDCDDADPGVHPHASESLNGVDDDCNVLVDEPWIAAGDLVITEVARQPYSGGSGTATNVYAQWFEVVNASSRELDLSGWLVLEAFGDAYYLSPEAGLRLAPGEYTVFCYGDSAFADPEVCTYTWGDPDWTGAYADPTWTLDRDEDRVALYAGGLAVDEVRWTWSEEEGYWPRVAARSMLLDPDRLDATLNDDPLNWCSADTTRVWSAEGIVGGPDYGTPGEANPSCTE